METRAATTTSGSSESPRYKSPDKSEKESAKARDNSTCNVSVAT